MSFGLSNAHGVCRPLMSIVLEGLEQFSMAYIDGILVFSSSVSEHFKHMQAVFERLRNNELKIKLTKILKEEKYLGINKNRIKPDIDNSIDA